MSLSDEAKCKKDKETAARYYGAAMHTIQDSYAHRWAILDQHLITSAIALALKYALPMVGMGIIAYLLNDPYDYATEVKAAEAVTYTDYELETLNRWGMVDFQQ